MITEANAENYVSFRHETDERLAGNADSPRRFLSFLWLRPTLIETEASINPIRVVGTRMKGVDRL